MSLNNTQLKDRINSIIKTQSEWASSLHPKVMEQAYTLAEGLEESGFIIYPFNNGFFFEKDTEDVHIELDIDETAIKEIEEGIFEVPIKFWRR